VPKSPILENQTAAANALGVDPEIVKRCRKLNADGCLAGGRYDVAKLRKWIAANAEKLKAEASNLSLREQKLAEEVRRLRFGNDVEEGLYIQRATVAQVAGEMASRVKTLTYAKLGNEYPAIMSADIASNRVAGLALAAQILAEFQEFADLWKPPPA
jgi:hypothetical protein